MRTVRNIAFCLLCGIVFFASIGNALFPVVTGAEPQTKSYLEGREYQEAPQISLDSFLAGTLQDEAEGFFGDYVPERDYVVLGNARLQRTAIDIAAAPFGFDARHTFYGSDYVYSPSLKRLFEVPYTISKWGPYCDSALPLYVSLMQKRPDVNWYFAMIDRPSTTADSPAASLVSQHADHDYFKKRLNDAVGAYATVVNLDNITFAAGDYFDTDHHLNIQGAKKAYTQTVEALGREPIEFGEDYPLYEGEFFGALARNGLITDYHDVVLDAAYDHGSYSVAVNGVQQDMDYLCIGYGDDSYTKPSRFANAYTGCFHGDPGLIEIRNDEAPEGTLVIVGDSFSNIQDRFFAENYQTVYVIDLRHYDGSLESFIEEHDVDDCVFLLGPNNLVSNEVSGNLNE